MFDWSFLGETDWLLAGHILGRHREPDLIIGTDEAYLYRWHVIPRGLQANTYLHVQVSSDPDRPLHDHPWDNFSVILSGGYDEVLGKFNERTQSWEPVRTEVTPLRVGQTRWRPAEQPHRLILPKHFDYTMTLFSTGPLCRDWGFWCKNGWRSHKDCTKVDESGRSVWVASDRELA